MKQVTNDLERHSTTTSDKARYIFGAFACIIYIVLMGALVFYAIPESNKSALDILIGSLSAILSMIFTFYFGSSDGSYNKTMALTRLANNTSNNNPLSSIQDADNVNINVSTPPTDTSATNSTSNVQPQTATPPIVVNTKPDTPDNTDDDTDDDTEDNNVDNTTPDQPDTDDTPDDVTSANTTVPNDGIMNALVKTKNS